MKCQYPLLVLFYIVCYCSGILLTKGSFVLMLEYLIVLLMEKISKQNYLC